MRKSTRRKLKVYAVDAAMILLAAQVTVVLKADNKAESFLEGVHLLPCKDCGIG